MSHIPPLRTPTRGGRALRGALVGLLAAGVLLPLRSTEPVRRVELQALDLRTRTYTATRPPDPRIVVAQVEDRDVAYVLGLYGQRWPWPLTLDSAMVDVLQRAGARVLVVDMLYLDKGAGPEDLPPGHGLGGAERTLRQAEQQYAKDYGDVLAAFGRAVIACELQDHPTWDVPPRRAAAEGLFDVVEGEPPPDALRRARAELPVLGVLHGAARLGFTNLPPAADGVARRAQVLARLGTRPVASLPTAAAALANGAALRYSEGALHLGGVRQPLDDDGTFLVNFRSDDSASGYARLGPGQLLDWAYTVQVDGKPLPAEAKEQLQGRIVILGVNLAGVQDIVPTPLGRMDGPVYQAAVLDNLLHGDGRVRAPAWADLLLLLLACVLTGLLVALPAGRLLPHLPPLLLAGAVVLVSFRVFVGGSALDLATPLLGVAGAWLGTSVMRLLTEGRRNRWLEATFGRYMAPSLIAALKRDPALLQLGGREREITVLFSDIAGFTTHAARLKPPQVVALLNRYLTDHTRAVMDHDGVVDKFEGDAVMAFFGDPVDQPDHALRACRAALAVVEALPRLEPVWRGLGLESFSIRIGLNTGRAVVGNMGSEQRFDYTCLGDSVNVASRIEGAAKAYGVTILVGGPTAASVAEMMLLKPLGAVQVVGRSEPVEVHELVGERGRAGADLEAHVAAFTEAIGAVRADDLGAARKALDKADVLQPGGGAAAWLRGLIEDLEAARRPRPWDGVTVLERK